ncbi:NAD(P)-dependent oxidoreductase [Pseudactinotalea sp. Z1739]|uniref:NAD(P)-dependent oxidoreductase n=1 Tax=Pseudactinotalea sp. Z1739 TaxID=3413028 RepID=UPI003C7ED8DC
MRTTPTGAARSRSGQAPVAVLGLGVMGAPVARNLVGAGYDVTVWNRSPGPASDLESVGATRARTPHDAAAPVVLSVLPDVAQLRTLLFGPEGLLAGLAGLDRTRLVVMSTTSPGEVRALAADLDEYDVGVVDAPMSGGDKGAREATMSIMMGGSETDTEAVRPVLETVGGTVLRMGGLGTGSLMKLCNQVIVAGALAATSEALAMAERGGLDLEDAVSILSGGLANSAVLELKQQKFLTGDYSLGGSAANQLKDLRYAMQTFMAEATPSPMTALLTQLFLEVERRGWGEQDHAVVFELFRTGYNNSPASRAGTET